MWHMSLLILGLSLGVGCNEEEGAKDTEDVGHGDGEDVECTRIQGREVDLERDCTIGVIEVACIEVPEPFALTGQECRVSDDGRVFVEFTAPSSFQIDGYAPCPTGLVSPSLGAYSEPCPAEPDE